MSTSIEWCVWWGGDDPNDCAGRLQYDDGAVDHGWPRSRPRGRTPAVELPGQRHRRRPRHPERVMSGGLGPWRGAGTSPVWPLITETILITGLAVVLALAGAAHLYGTVR